MKVSNSLQSLMYKYVIKTYLDRFKMGFVENIPQSIKDKLDEGEIQQLSTIAVRMVEDFINEFREKLSQQKG